ncbi:MAG: hypothetical protein K2X69_09030 [Silvanigrellaceae bacterium]|nr:hypothetical protein [Silvanigrellaceae bacterium]
MLDPQTLGKKLAETATKSDPSDPNAMWLKIATDIIDHLKTMGVINVTVATTGSPTAQTGTGVGKIS